MKWNWGTLRIWIRKVISRRKGKGMDPDLLKQMARGIMTTRPDEIACDECFQQMDRFVEMKLAGADPAEAMPLVQDHLTRCDSCREEFEALLAALKAID
jgi:hypothetical protein